jgi:hypothetical protein
MVTGRYVAASEASSPQTTQEGRRASPQDRIFLILWHSSRNSCIGFKNIHGAKPKMEMLFASRQSAM